METPILHVYSPYAHHSESYIVGTRSALTLLSVYLHEVLANIVSETYGPLFINDGEGFQLNIRLETEEGMNAYAVPYAADYAAEQDNDAGGNPDWPKR